MIIAVSQYCLNNLLVCQCRDENLSIIVSIPKQALSLNRNNKILRLLTDDGDNFKFLSSGCTPKTLP